MHRRANGRCPIAAAQPIDPKHGIMEGFDAQALQFHRHTSAHNAALSHVLDIFEGKAGLAVVLVRAEREDGGMSCGKLDEARTRRGVWL